jgi:hypothetical protein
MNHDQPKKGAGRPPLPAGQRKERVSVRLPPPLVELLRAEESPAKTITEALQDYYKEEGNE